MENECEALPGVAYPGVRDNRSTINTKTGYDDDDLSQSRSCLLFVVSALVHEAHYKVPPPKSKAFYQRLMAMTALILEQFKNEWMILVLRAQLRPWW